MGRHSAASDDESDESSAAASSVAVVEDDRPSGRHSAAAKAADPVESTEPEQIHRPSPGPHRDADAKADTARIPLITDPIVDRPIPESETVQIAVITAPLLDEPRPEPAPAPGPAPAPKASGHATAADIALIRGHGDVRARAFAAVLIPFVVYVGYQLVVGDISNRSFLVWLWIPVIVAGVLFGLTLDAGHKRYGSPGPSDQGSPDP